MCDKSKLLCNFAQIFKEIVMRKRFIHILWAVFGTGILTVILAFVAIWFGKIGYMPDIEDLRESYQQICHSGLLCRWQGAWYVEPEQGEPYRNSLQENVTLFNKGTGGY